MFTSIVKWNHWIPIEKIWFVHHCSCVLFMCTPVYAYCLQRREKIFTCFTILAIDVQRNSRIGEWLMRNKLRKKNGNCKGYWSSMWICCQWICACSLTMYLCWVDLVNVSSWSFWVDKPSGIGFMPSVFLYLVDIWSIVWLWDQQLKFNVHMKRNVNDVLRWPSASF